MSPGGITPPPGARAVLDALQAAGHEAVFVGGCVRDRLLGRPAADWDVATDAPPETVMALFDKAIPTGLQHGTVTVVAQGEPVEVTTYRVERGYADGRRPDEVIYTRELADDLGRRDFTMNAMAWDPVVDRLVDPFGGQADLTARTVRAVGDAVERFTEDGLRPLRAVRFAAVLGFALDPATEAAIGATRATFRRVSAERVRVEFVKTLLSSRPGWGMAALHATGLLADFLPEVDALGRARVALVEAALGRTPARLAVRLAVTLWDVEDADAPLRRLTFSNAERRAVVHLHGFRHVDPSARRDDVAVWRLVATVGADALDDLLAVGAAVGDAAAWRALGARIDALGARRGPLTTRELPIDGRDVMQALDLPPSRRLGRLLEALLERVWADPALADRDALLALLPAVDATLDAEEAP